MATAVRLPSLFLAAVSRTSIKQVSVLSAHLVTRRLYETDGVIQDRRAVLLKGVGTA